MQRSDTTARKWNASRPTYDEGWSDDEYSEDEAASVAPKANFMAGQIDIRPPWEAVVEAELAAMPVNSLQPESNEGSRTLPTTAQGTLRSAEPTLRRVSLQDRSASASVATGKVQGASDTSQAITYDKTIVDTAQFLAETPLVQPAISRRTEPVGSDAFEALRMPNHHEIKGTFENSGASSSRRISSDRLHASVAQNQASHVPLEVRAPLPRASPDVEEDTPLRDLMFSPEQLPYDNENYSDSDDDSNQVRQLKPHSDEAEENVSATHTIPGDTPTTVSVPTFPGDFADGLKSRALSDAILETYHIPQEAVIMERSDSEPLETDKTSILAERTPSILLSTNIWAEKNRLLKEQIERNRKLKEAEEQRVVGPSTYDHEYDYATPQPFTERPVQPRPEEPHIPQHQFRDLSRGGSPAVLDVSNLNTLHEEAEEEEEDGQSVAAAETVPRTATPKTAATTTTRIEKVPVRSSDRGSATFSDRPASARSYDTNKSLPKIQRSTTNSDAESVQSGSQVADESDNENAVLSAEQEHAMLKSLALPPVAAHEARGSSKELPPISQITSSSPRNSLPPIQTELQAEIAPAIASNEYTPSLYSAIPFADDSILQKDTSPSIEGKADPAMKTVVEHALQNEINASKPVNSEETRNGTVSDSWEPLRTKPGTTQNVENTPAELSRFSTSTVQTMDEDDYHFDTTEELNSDMLGSLVDKPYSDDGDSFSEGRMQEELTTIPAISLRNSASAATLQPPLRHMQSTQTLTSDTSNTTHRQSGSRLESERLADELLEQLSGSHDGREVIGTTRDAGANAPGTADGTPVTNAHQMQLHVAAPTSAPAYEELQDKSPHRPVGNRARTSSSGSKFLEVITPGTSLEQARSEHQVKIGELQMQSAKLLRYRDIKQLPSAAQRTAEYRRRSVALYESSSGLTEYLATMQLHLQAQQRRLPGPAQHIDFKSNKSILPDKLIPNDLSRTTARLGDKSIDAAKGLLSKSSRGIKGLFHSTSRSVSGPRKSTISAPLESKESPVFHATVAAPTSPAGASGGEARGNLYEETPSPSRGGHEEGRGPVRLASPMSLRSVSTPDGTRNPRSTPAAQTHSPAVSKIQAYFPDLATGHIEAALRQCDGDEQRAIGYLVVHRSPIR